MDVTGSIDTKDPNDTHKEVKRIYESLFGLKLFDRVDNTLEAVVKLFSGEYPGYQKCDTAYHDLEHTLHAYLAMARILDGLIRENNTATTEEFIVLGLISTLGHDTGFIKENGDNVGTGAKYTLIHVDRSKEFMGKYLPNLGFQSSQIQYVKNMISCTGLTVDLPKISFTLEKERETGHAVGTADLLGQMSDPNYLEKLPKLYQEYEEGGFLRYPSAQHLMKETPNFFEDFVMQRLTSDFNSIYRFAAIHFGGRNLYIDGIRRNITLLKERIHAN